MSSSSQEAPTIAAASVAGASAATPEAPGDARASKRDDSEPKKVAANAKNDGDMRPGLVEILETKKQNQQRVKLVHSEFQAQYNQVRSKQHKLEKIRQELARLDASLMGNIDMLRHEIETVDRQVSSAQRRFDAAEREYFESRKLLQTRNERKRLLTEHLDLIILTNEKKKAAKLAALMDELGLEEEATATHQQAVTGLNVPSANVAAARRVQAELVAAGMQKHKRKVIGAESLHVEPSAKLTEEQEQKQRLEQQKRQQERRRREQLHQKKSDSKPPEPKTKAQPPPPPPPQRPPPKPVDPAAAAEAEAAARRLQQQQIQQLERDFHQKQQPQKQPKQPKQQQQQLQGQQQEQQQQQRHRKQEQEQQQQPRRQQQPVAIQPARRVRQVATKMRSSTANGYHQQRTTQAPTGVFTGFAVDDGEDDDGLS